MRFFLSAILILGLSRLLQAQDLGKTVYEQNCLSCHQQDGRGVPNLNPPLVGTSWVIGDKQQLIQIVLRGLETPLEIDGELYHNPMPANTHLSDAEVAAVLTYIRSHFGNKASAVSTAEVKKARAKK